MLPFFNVLQNCNTRQTSYKCSILLNYLWHACYKNILYTRHTLDIKRYIAIGDITIRCGLVSAICRSEIAIIKKSAFVQKTRINTCFNSSFLFSILAMLEVNNNSMKL